MKDQGRQPTKLDRLEEVTRKLRGWIGVGYPDDLEGLIEDAVQWLDWTLSFLEARKLYHKKTRIKTAMLERMARTLLSRDELEEIDRQAERALQGATPTKGEGDDDDDDDNNDNGEVLEELYTPRPDDKEVREG